MVHRVPEVHVREHPLLLLMLLLLLLLLLHTQSHNYQHPQPICIIDDDDHDDHHDDDDHDDYDDHDDVPTASNTRLKELRVLDERVTNVTWVSANICPWTSVIYGVPSVWGGHQCEHLVYVQARDRLLECVPSRVA